MKQAARSGGGQARIRDVAERAGVSIATVSRILNGTYPPAPKTRKKVMDAVEALDYVANPHARALIRQGSDTIAIVLSTIDDGPLGTMVQSVATHASAEGRLCLIATTGADPARELSVLKQMRGQGVDAIILVAGAFESDAYRRGLAKFAQSLEGSGTRLVLCARPQFDPKVPTAGVEYDNAGGSYAATSHLLSRGHRRILCLAGPELHSTTTLRVDGYRRALADLGGELDPRLELTENFDNSTGYATMRRLLAEGHHDFTAVVAYNDRVAAGAIQAVREAGLRVPEDISFVGFDDSPLAAGLGLTSVHIPSRDVGRTALSLALDTGEWQHPVMLGTHVVVRDSVQPPTAP